MQIEQIKHLPTKSYFVRFNQKRASSISVLTSYNNLLHEQADIRMCSHAVKRDFAVILWF